MYINPITPISSKFVSAIEPLKSIRGDKINETQTQTQKENTGGLTFADMLKNIIDGVQTTSAQTKTDAFKLALGLADDSDLHNIEINAVKADLALRNMVSVRNKIMEAYTEIMRINV